MDGVLRSHVRFGAKLEQLRVESPHHTHAIVQQGAELRSQTLQTIRLESPVIFWVFDDEPRNRSVLQLQENVFTQFDCAPVFRTEPQSSMLEIALDCLCGLLPFWHE